MYYDYSKIDSYHCPIKIVVSRRGLGKTFGKLKMCTERFVTKQNRFIYVVETGEMVQELTKNNGEKFWSALLEYYSEQDTARKRYFYDHLTELKVEDNDEDADGYKELFTRQVKARIVGGTIKINGETAGYIIDMNSFGEIKRNNFNKVKYIIDKAYDKDINICFNPAPFDRSILDLPLEKVSLLVVNEIEGAALAGIDSSFEKVLKTIKQRYPKCNILLTLGSDGSLYYGNNEVVSQNCFKVKAVDTTAAGDTFIGYFLASITDGFDIKDALEIASAASAITVSRNGAMDSIPYKEEVVEFLKDRK